VTHPLVGVLLASIALLLAYAYGDSTTNLLQPCFAIPILAVTRLRFGDILGCTCILALTCFVMTLAALALSSPRL